MAADKESGGSWTGQDADEEVVVPITIRMREVGPRELDQPGQPRETGRRRRSARPQMPNVS